MWYFPFIHDQLMTTTLFKMVSKNKNSIFVTQCQSIFHLIGKNNNRDWIHVLLTYPVANAIMHSINLCRVRNGPENLNIYILYYIILKQAIIAIKIIIYSIFYEYYLLQYLNLIMYFESYLMLSRMPPWFLYWVSHNVFV